MRVVTNLRNGRNKGGFVNTAKKIIVVLCLFSVGGCATIRGLPHEPRTSTIAKGDAEGLILPSDFERYDKETNTDTKQIIRNEILDERMAEIDRKFNEYEVDLWKEGIGSGVGTDWIQLAIAGATATMGGAAIKAALGAASAGVIGAKASFDKHALMQKTLPTLVSTMVAERAFIRAKINGNKLHPVNIYSLYEGAGNLEALKHAGSIIGAIQVIAKQAGETVGQAKETEKETSTMKTKMLQNAMRVEGEK